jgi:hypothetical protein
MHLIDRCDAFVGASMARALHLGSVSYAVGSLEAAVAR